MNFRGVIERPRMLSLTVIVGENSNTRMELLQTFQPFYGNSANCRRPRTMQSVGFPPLERSRSPRRCLAAVPHIVHALASAPSRADHSYFQFPAWVEICRAKGQVEIPDDLRTAYFESLAQMPALARAASDQSWEPGFLVFTLAAITAA